MATIRKLRIGEWGLGIGRRLFHLLFAIPYSPFAIVLLLLSLAFSLSACTSTRPVAKIGLLAPFEGVYRQEGYDALAAMRAALSEQNLSGIDVLPLALDSSRDAMRAGQKVLADPSVAAVIGPYWAVEGLSDRSVFDDDRWLHPYAPSQSERWAEDAVEAASAFAEGEGRSLVLAGIPAGWPPMDVATAMATIAGADDVQPGQTVLWLADAAAGADFAKVVWQRLPDTPIGLYAAGADTFRLRVGEPTTGPLFSGPLFSGPLFTGPLFVVGWIDDDYPAWAASHSPNSSTAYTVYRQTADALKRLAGENVTTVWKPAILILDDTGRPVLPSAE